MTERMNRALNAGADRVGEAADRVGEAADRVGEAVADVAARVKPRLRGVSHFWAFFVALVAGAVLVLTAPSGKATLAAAIYASSLSALFGVSALYHRVDWRPSARRWMRRLDHSMIFLLIAGTVTPFALIALGGALYTAGAVIYARQRPDPNPAGFGYHEIFHVLVIAAAAAHFAAIALFALPAGLGGRNPPCPQPPP